MAKITWLHFSDIHYKDSEDFDRSRVIEALFSDLKNQAALGLTPDFVLFTGDIAYSGKAQEYQICHDEFIQPLLYTFDLPRDKAFFVPGNHDVERGRINDLNPQIMQDLRDRESVNAFLGNSDRMKMYLSPFQNFTEYLRKHFPESASSESDGYTFSQIVELSGTKLKISGINTAMRSGHGAARENSEQGQMFIGERQLLNTISTDDADVSILCMHHPLSWLQDSDRAIVEPIISKNFDIVHHGHVHRPNEFFHQVGSIGDYFSFGAAACYDRRVGTEPYQNGYSVFQLDLFENTLTMILRKYSDAPIPKWIANEEITGEGTGGKRVFSLRKAEVGKKRQDPKHNRFLDVRDLYKEAGPQAIDLLAISSKMRAQRASASLAADAYRTAVTDWLNCNHDIGLNTELVALTVLAGEALVIGTQDFEGTDPTHEIEASVREIVDFTIGSKAGKFAKSLDDIISLFSHVLDDYKSAPFAITNSGNLTYISQVLTPIFFSCTISMLANSRFAQTVLPESANITEDYGKSAVMKSNYSRDQEFSVYVSTPKVTDFMRISVLRHYIEARIELIKDALIASNVQFHVRNFRVSFIERPDDWREHRFTVDPTRVIRVLMGSELYGKGSHDVWFRELLQNSIDACTSRQKFSALACPDIPTISISYDPIGRVFSIEDEGIGMTRDHIERYLCRAGKSIWRSEELEKFFKKTNQAKNVSIGKFGVGFLSVFQVCESVEIETTFASPEASTHALKITNLEEPFFVRDSRLGNVGTRLSIQFRRDYEPNLRKIADQFVLFQPSEVKISGLTSFPKNQADALNRMVEREERVNTQRGSDVVWHFDEVSVQGLRASLSVAVPTYVGSHSAGRSWNADKNSPMPQSVEFTVTNRGIVVLSKNTEWLGANSNNSDDKSSGIKGLKVILNFEEGSAPVTVSRNDIKIDDSEAQNLLELIGDVALRVLSKKAHEILAEGDKVEATRRAISMFLNSTKPPRYQWSRKRGNWSENVKVSNAFNEMLRDIGVLEVYKAGNPEAKLERTIRGLENATESVVVCTKERLRSKLFQLYLTKVSPMLVIQARDSWEVDLLVGAGFGWKKLEADGDLWSAINVQEERGCALTSYISAEMALASSDYFTSKDDFLMILPRKKARAEDTVGLKRAAVRFPPRVLLNIDHELTVALIGKVAGRDYDKELSRIFDFLMSAVVNEKGKTRRNREYGRLISELVEIAGCKSDIVAELIA